MWKDERINSDKFSRKMSIPFLCFTFSLHGHASDLKGKKCSFLYFFYHSIVVASLLSVGIEIEQEIWNKYLWSVNSKVGIRKCGSRCIPRLPPPPTGYLLSFRYISFPFLAFPEKANCETKRERAPSWRGQFCKMMTQKDTMLKGDNFPHAFVSLSTKEKSSVTGMW